MPAVLRLLGKPEESIMIVVALLAEDPMSPEAHRELGLALASTGDYARAQPILESAWQRGIGRIAPNGGLFPTESATALIAIRRDTDAEVEHRQH
jgi:Flp pilus assembly protein TadD